MQVPNVKLWPKEQENRDMIAALAAKYFKRIETLR